MPPQRKGVPPKAGAGQPKPAPSKAGAAKPGGPKAAAGTTGGGRPATPKKVKLQPSAPAGKRPLAGLADAVARSWKRLVPPSPMVRAASSRLHGAFFKAPPSIKSQASSSAESNIELSTAAILEKRDSWEGTQCVEGATFESRFLQREVLGEGSFGTVHRVLRVSDGVELAAKAIRRLPAANPRAEKEWSDAKAEAAAWQTLSSPYHPSILPLIEKIEEPEAGVMYLVTELMICGELADAVFFLEMSEQAARLITVQLSSAIAHLHLHHMMAHLDVKPQNVLCQAADPTAIGCLKLADFGLCRSFERRLEQSFREPCGTLDYFAPELAACLEAEGQMSEATGGGSDAASDTARYGPAVDCWALGCVVYELLHGHPPYCAPGMGDEEILEGIKSHRLPFPATSFGGMSTNAIDFLKRLLEPDPSKRILIEDALAHPWLQPVADESLRVQMASAVRNEVAQRRAARMRAKMQRGVLKVVAANWLSKQDAPPPKPLARAPSSVRSTKDVLALTRAASRRVDLAMPLEPDEQDTAAARGGEAEAEDVDPMVVYASVYHPASLAKLEA